MKTLKDYQANKNNPQATAPAPGREGHDEEVQNDDQTGEGEDVYRRSRMNYKEHAKKYFTLSAKTWKSLWLLNKHCAGPIINNAALLEQLIHTSLNAQLHYLVGPEMKNIKVMPSEYEELSFNPKELVRQIAEIFLFLVRANRDEVVRIVAKDERYYKSSTFVKAVNFSRKHFLLQGNDLTEFDAFVKELSVKVDEQRAANDEADAPDEFLDEMMCTIMSDPVMFPQSKIVVDRSTAERTIRGSDKDPYSNTPVTLEQLIPQAELKEKIHRFAKEKGIQLEGGNMFD